MKTQQHLQINLYYTDKWKGILQKITQFACFKKSYQRKAQINQQTLTIYNTKNILKTVPLINFQYQLQNKNSIIGNLNKQINHPWVDSFQSRINMFAIQRNYSIYFDSQKNGQKMFRYLILVKNNVLNMKNVFEQLHKLFFQYWVKILLYNMQMIIIQNKENQEEQQNSFLQQNIQKKQQQIGDSLLKIQQQNINNDIKQLQDYQSIKSQENLQTQQNPIQIWYKLVEKKFNKFSSIPACIKNFRNTEQFKQIDNKNNITIFQEYSNLKKIKNKNQNQQDILINQQNINQSDLKIRFVKSFQNYQLYEQQINNIDINKQQQSMVLKKYKIQQKKSIQQSFINQKQQSNITLSDKIMIQNILTKISLSQSESSRYNLPQKKKIYVHSVHFNSSKHYIFYFHLNKQHFEIKHSKINYKFQVNELPIIIKYSLDNLPIEEIRIFQLEIGFQYVNFTYRSNNISGFLIIGSDIQSNLDQLTFSLEKRMQICNLQLEMNLFKIEEVKINGFQPYRKNIWNLIAQNKINNKLSLQEQLFKGLCMTYRKSMWMQWCEVLSQSQYNSLEACMNLQIEIQFLEYIKKDYNSNFVEDLRKTKLILFGMWKVFNKFQMKVEIVYRITQYLSKLFPEFIDFYQHQFFCLTLKIVRIILTLIQHKQQLLKELKEWIDKEVLKIIEKVISNGLLSFMNRLMIVRFLDIILYISDIELFVICFFRTVFYKISRFSIDKSEAFKKFLLLTLDIDEVFEITFQKYAQTLFKY